MASITLVCGPPCAGKNTYVTQHVRPGDLIIDFDALMAAASGGQTHEHDDQLKPFVFDARDAMIHRLVTRGHDRHAWIILTAPRADERARYAALGAEIVLLIPPRDTLLTRANAERPSAWVSYIDNWFAAYTPDGAEPVDRDAISVPALSRVRTPERHPGLT